MKKIKIKINFKDTRGIIVDLLEKKKINAITYITQNKGKVRGNHFHKKTTQWNYLIKGRIKIVTKKKNKSVKKVSNGGKISANLSFNEEKNSKAKGFSFKWFRCLSGDIGKSWTGYFVAENYGYFRAQGSQRKGLL